MRAGLKPAATLGRKRKMVVQALLHGVDHRAQLATFLRQEGFGGLWVHDLIASDVME